MTTQTATKLGRAAQTIIGAMDKEKTTLHGLATKAVAVLARKSAKPSVRVPSEAEKAAARKKFQTRTAKPAAKSAPVKSAPIELDNGDRLIAARDLWRDTMTAAHRLSRTASRNLTGAELRLIEAARALPRIAPNEGSTLREWRSFAAKVEAARPVIAAARKRI
jgi:hypothetical protein